MNARWADFDLEAATWTKPAGFTKQRKAHRVPLSRPALELLREMKVQVRGEWLFPSPRLHGRPVQEIRTWWNRIRQRAALAGVRIHDLRHSFASMLVSGGVGLPVIGELLGHSQPSTTARYAHLYDSALREATETAARALAGPSDSDD